MTIFAVTFICCCICKGFSSQVFVELYARNRQVGKFVMAASHSVSQAADFVY